MTGSEQQVTLSRKLGLKPGFLIYTNLSQHEYISLTGRVNISFAALPMTPGSIDLAHIFIESTDQLTTELHHIYPALQMTGSLWVSWQKGKQAKESGLNRDYIREFILETDLVDTKVCSVNEQWSALKFMYRLSKR